MLGISTIVIFAFLYIVAAPHSRIGFVVLLIVCGYYASVFALNRTVATVTRDRIVVRRGPIPIWPAATIDARQIADVRAFVARGITGRGGRMELHPIVAMLTNDRSAAIIDDTGDAGTAEYVAAEISAWLERHRGC